MSQDTIEVKIDDDYGRPTDEWLSEQGFHLVGADQSGYRHGDTKFIIGWGDEVFYTYKVSYRSDGFVVWNTAGDTVEATRCYRKVRMISEDYFDDNPD